MITVPEEVQTPAARTGQDLMWDIFAAVGSIYMSDLFFCPQLGGKQNPTNPQTKVSVCCLILDFCFLSPVS